MTLFARYVGIDYSGAGEPTAPARGLRAFTATPDTAPAQVRPPDARHWSRATLTAWLGDVLRAPEPAIVGIDHAFAFPRSYFAEHHLASWDAFLDDFATHWPTDRQSVQSLRPHPSRRGDADQYRLCEQWTSSAKSVFLFDVQGAVAMSTHAGLPWLRRLRRENPALFVWPFDGWTVPPGRSVVAEVYPSLFRRRYAPIATESADEHDARAICTWLRERDALGALASYFTPTLSLAERETAALEGWILGVL